MVHLDYVPEMIGSASANVDVIGVLDSPLWMMMDGCTDCGRGVGSGLSVTTILAQNAFQPDHTGAACDAAYPGETWKCFFAEYRLPPEQEVGPRR